MAVISETASVITQFGEMCARRGWVCFYSDQQRTDLEYDVWNPNNPKARAHVQGKGADSEQLDHIGWHSVRGLSLARSP